MPSGSGMAAVGHLYNHPVQSHSSPSFMQGGAIRVVSKDDASLSRQTSAEQAKRYRRRSTTLGSEDTPSTPTEVRPTPPPLVKSYASVVSTPYNPQNREIRPFAQVSRPNSSHGRTDSDTSGASSRSASRPSSVSFLIRVPICHDDKACTLITSIQSKRDATGLGGSTHPTGPSTTPAIKHEPKLVSIPPRGSSDANKRVPNPSPLSKPMALTSNGPPTKESFAKLVQSRNTAPAPTTSSPPAPRPVDSPAAQQLAALSKKDAKKKGKPSRLRRAFSFGSAAELRKASAENSHNSNIAAERQRLKKERFDNEEEAREAAIVQQQEASGLGEGIYSGQGHFFTGSTDNLSISSTASSASIMLRKMGKGVKKSTRSLVGLFRPKSVIGVPAADAAVPEASMAQVSMVTIEAEREKVNVNINPHDQVGGGTGYPKLERNSLDTSSLGTSEPSLSFSDRSSDNVKPRRSIVGGEEDRARVLAAVRKGILKSILHIPCST